MDCFVVPSRLVFDKKVAKLYFLALMYDMLSEQIGEKGTVLAYSCLKDMNYVYAHAILFLTQIHLIFLPQLSDRFTVRFAFHVNVLGVVDIWLGRGAHDSFSIRKASSHHFR